jgi:hypothetical protein
MILGNCSNEEFDEGEMKISIRQAELMLPDLVPLSDLGYVQQLEKDKLGPRLIKIDYILDKADLTPAMWKTATIARGNILEVMADVFETETN